MTYDELFLVKIKKKMTYDEYLLNKVLIRLFLKDLKQSKIRV